MGERISIICSIISAFCAVGSLIAAILIGRSQGKQGDRMEALALRQDAEAKRQKAQQLKAQRDSFLMKYFNEKDDIYLLPLCWVAALYNPALAYHRNMFREYNMLEEDVQDAICDYMGLKLIKPKLRGKDFYYFCVDIIKKVEQKYRPKESNGYPELFYDGAKYLFKCLEDYRAKTLPWNLYDLERYLYKCLREHDGGNIEFSNPLGQYVHYFEFSQIKTPELNACEVCAVAAKVLANWEGQEIHCQDNVETSTSNNSDEEENKYWIPGEYAHERLETMEDLFLCALFSIYANLVLPNQDSGVCNDSNK